MMTGTAEQDHGSRPVIANRNDITSTTLFVPEVTNGALQLERLTTTPC